LVRDVARFDEKDRPLVVRGLLLGGFKVGDVKGILHAFRMLPENLKPKAELVSRAAGIVPDDMRSFFGDSVIDEAEGISASDRISVIHETLQKVGPSLLSRIPDQFWSEFQDSQLLIDLIDSHGVEGLDSALSRYEQLSSEVASRLVSAEKVNLVASHLPSFREVRPEVAEALTQSGFSHKVFEHFSRFDWDVPSCARFLNNLVSQDCALVLENLHRIPSHLLEGLEGENVFLERFKKDIGIGSERIYEMYRKRCMSGNPAKRREFVEAVSRLVEGMVSPKSHSDALISHPLYGELVNSVYTSHSGTFGPQELLDSPGGVRNVDRSGDIRRFAFDSKYTIDLAEGVRMVLRDGTSRATELMNAIQDPILFARGVAQNLTRVARGEPLQKAIAEEFSKLGPLPDGSSIEERLGLLLCNVVEGSSTKKQFMDCFLLHHMLVTSGELEFLRATQARSERAKNKDYAYLLLLREYFSDKLFDTAKNLFSEALKSSHVFERLATLHERVSGETLVKERRALMGRLQLSEAGMSQRVLDVIAEKLQDDRIPSAKKREIVSSIVSREQRRAAQLLRHLGEKPERPDAIHLGRFTDALPSLLSREAEIVPLESSGALDFFTSCFEGVVSPDIQSIDLEVKKYRVARGER
ncbi:MAG: hypothetical protein KDD64_17245, partial [Bdellovibrionales bacterium]|nr:hypothetical protein [Bdellovibrionales bacterium]